MSPETDDHVMMNCTKYGRERGKLMEKIAQIYRKNDIKQDRRGYGMNKILFSMPGLWRTS